MSLRVLTLMVIVAALAAGGVTGGQPVVGVAVAVDASRPGAAIPATLFGLFFEDINFAADGGLYPELVKNRSFEFPEPLMGWARAARGGAKGTAVSIERSQKDGANRHFVRVDADVPGQGFGLTNEGFRGMGVRAGAAYQLTLRARRAAGGPSTLAARIETKDGTMLAEAGFSGLTTSWQEYRATLTPSATEPRAVLTLLVNAPGAIEIDTVSLFPRETWNKRPNGLRTDLVAMLHELRPGFIRFPGGCIVEGRHLETRYQWKTTIGPVDERRLIVNRWNNENEHKAPDYYQSFGLGFYEYFVLSEDLGAEPLPILNCGMACQFNSSELASLETLDEYIQDALDLIEFANAPATTPWGKRRAEMGHPAPFNMKMIGVGNEQWGPQYAERFAAFAAVLRAKHPEIALVGSTGPDPSGDRFDYLWAKMREHRADFVDEHFYRPPQWFLTQVHRYDAYPRTGPKVFAGEFAAHTTGAGRDRRGNVEAAIAEAAVMTGIERNADIVHMASYAPLFGHVDAWQWRPNLIWFDNLRVYGTPSYYVQQLFARNRGTHVLPIRLEGLEAGAPVAGSASLDKGSGEVIVKLVNASAQPRDVTVALSGVPASTGTARVTLLGGAPDAENTLDAPAQVSPRTETVPVSTNMIRYTLPPQTLAVIRAGR